MGLREEGRVKQMPATSRNRGGEEKKSCMMLTSLSFPKIGEGGEKIKSDVSLLFRRVAVTPPLPKGLSFLKKERFFERLGKCGKVGHLTER